MNEALLRSLLAGWICGAAGGLAVATGLVIVVSRRPALAGRLGLPRLGFAATWVLLANALVIGWTLVGLLLGALHHAAGEPRFSLGVTGLTVALLGAYRFVRGRPGGLEARVVVGGALVAAVTFAGALPLLASWA